MLTTSTDTPCLQCDSEEARAPDIASSSHHQHRIRSSGSAHWHALRLEISGKRKAKLEPVRSFINNRPPSPSPFIEVHNGPVPMCEEEEIHHVCCGYGNSLSTEQLENLWEALFAHLESQKEELCFCRIPSLPSFAHTNELVGHIFECPHWAAIIIWHFKQFLKSKHAPVSLDMST